MRTDIQLEASKMKGIEVRGTQREYSSKPLKQSIVNVF